MAGSQYQRWYVSQGVDDSRPWRAVKVWNERVTVFILHVVGSHDGDQGRTEDGEIEPHFTPNTVSN
jgi:hypothetical protein